MAQNVTWTGKSGKRYEYTVHGLNTTWNEVAANYIFANGSYQALYVGETGNLKERMANHEKMQCAERNGVTHICSHTNSAGQAARRAEEQDIIAMGKPVCND